MMVLNLKFLSRYIKLRNKATQKQLRLSFIQEFHGCGPGIQQELNFQEWRYMEKVVGKV